MSSLDRPGQNNETFDPDSVVSGSARMDATRRVERILWVSAFLLPSQLRKAAEEEDEEEKVALLVLVFWCFPHTHQHHRTTVVVVVTVVVIKLSGGLQEKQQCFVQKVVGVPTGFSDCSFEKSQCGFVLDLRSRRQSFRARRQSSVS